MYSKIVLFSGFIIIIFSVFIAMFVTNKNQHPYEGLTVDQLVEKFEYPVEVHETTTDDGYILTLYRIPRGRNETSKTRTPILFVHPFALTAWDYVQFGPNTSLCFLLAEQGFDVWLGNVRGTTLSRKHKSLDPDKDSAYWEFSLQEMAVYDLPAFIDHILKTTRQDKLQYLGYSQSAALVFIMHSERHEYARKIKLMTIFAPSVFMNNPGSPIVKYLAGVWKTLEKILRSFNMHEVFKKCGVIDNYFKFICGKNAFLHNFCLHNIFIIFGYSYDELDRSSIPLFSLNTPNGVSLRQIIHLFQIIETGNFSKFDFGSEKNLKIYGQEQPPRYNLSKVTTPVALYYSNNDWIINLENIKKLTRVLPNIVNEYKVPVDSFNHYDFISAKNVVSLLYTTVIKTILMYR